MDVTKKAAERPTDSGRKVYDTVSRLYVSTLVLADKDLKFTRAIELLRRLVHLLSSGIRSKLLELVVVWSLIMHCDGFQHSRFQV